MKFFIPRGIAMQRFFCLALFIMSTISHAATAPRERLLFNTAWRFQKDDPADAGNQLDYDKTKKWVNATGNEFSKNAPFARPSGNLGDGVSFTRSNFADAAWRTLNLPHDWGIEGPFKQEYDGSTGKLPWWGIGWYRKHFSVAAGDTGKQIYLQIEGAMSHSLVWLNGQFVGGWPYGYSSFQLDLTPYLKSGDNVIAIRLNNPPDSSRWYPGGGIYRNVWLLKTAPLHIAQWGTYITTPEVTQGAATIDLQTVLENSAAQAANLTLRTQIHAIGASGKLGKALATLETKEINVPAQARQNQVLQIRLANPKLWNLEKPQLYTAVTTIKQNGRIVDSYQTEFGIRTVAFDAAKGFFLNGKLVEIKGVCNHHDLGALGAAFNVRAAERQIEILQEMGCNAIRTSHNPPAPELLDLCDRMGMLVMDESFDCWRSGKTTNDYHRDFDDWHEKDLRALVRRDRNHPSVILWSIGNEVHEQGSPEGHKIAAELSAIVRDEDTTRLTTAGCNDTRAGYNGFEKTIDVFGYNYKPGEYGKFHKAHPNQPIYGSETASCVSSRGEYFFPFSNNKDDGRANFQVSSYDLYAPGWAMPPDWEFKGQDQNPFVGGEFVWTGFDYLGEPTPYNNDVTNLLNFSDAAAKARMEKELADLGKIRVPSRSSYFGILDLCGFKKDRFYIYQARWRPDLPLAHILPHWNWPERVGQVTPIHVYTSGDEAELFLNGKSLGRKTKGALEYRIRWDDVIYEPGEVRVVAYKNGQKWAEETVVTTGPTAQIKLDADHKTIKADGQDLSFVTVSVADAEGLMVPHAKNHLRFEISGPGEIVGVDNGDATGHESFQSNERDAYNGLCLVIVRATNKAGEITLRAASEGLKNGAIVILSK